jgi:hypothetical protein
MFYCDDISCRIRIDGDKGVFGIAFFCFVGADIFAINLKIEFFADDRFIVFIKISGCYICGSLARGGADFNSFVFYFSISELSYTKTHTISVTYDYDSVDQFVIVICPQFLVQF